jgi:hypothetical protein
MQPAKRPRHALTGLTTTGGIESVHPLHGPELRALRPLQGNSPYVFTIEAGTPVTPSWFLRMVQRTGTAAKLPFTVHPHMLRHSTGNDGHDTRSQLANADKVIECETMHSRLAATIFLDYWNLRAAIKFSLSKISIFSADRLIGHSRAADAAKEFAAAQRDLRHRSRDNSQSARIAHGSGNSIAGSPPGRTREMPLPLFLACAG